MNDLVRARVSVNLWPSTRSTTTGAFIVIDEVNNHRRRRHDRLAAPWPRHC
jgi:hypothetical protein